MWNSKSLKSLFWDQPSHILMNNSKIELFEDSNEIFQG